MVDETDPDEIQIHYNDEFLYAYGYNQTITIFNVTTKCKNQVYKLSPRQQFQIGTYKHQAEYQRKFGTFKIEVYENEILNNFILGKNQKYESSSKDLEMLLENNGSTTSEENSSVILLIYSIIITSIIIGIMVGYLFYYYRKKIKRHPAVESPVETTELQELPSAFARAEREF